MSDMPANLEAMLARGADSASLRYTLASKYREAGELQRALTHANAALAFDAEYSAAWRLLGRVQAELGQAQAAVQTYRRGIEVAERRGDKQAAKEMRVFLNRLERPR
jgi:Tfp pilus assembly protein PilF